MNTHVGREDLERRAEEVRAHLQANLDDFERRSHDRIIQDRGQDATIQTEEAPRSPARRRLERRADRVREHLIDRIEEVELRARERVLPIVLTGAAVMGLFAIGFGVLLYRSFKR